MIGLEHAARHDRGALRALLTVFRVQVDSQQSLREDHLSQERTQQDPQGRRNHSRALLHNVSVV